MGALLTTTMPCMKVVIQTLKDEGMRDKVYVMVGGAPVSAAFAEEVEADAYGCDAATVVDVAKRYMANKREKQTA